MEYAEKLRDPRWQKKRLEILSRDKFTCQACFDDRQTLHVHHMMYIKNEEPWEIDGLGLVTVCENCHSKLHSNDARLVAQVYTKLYFSLWFSQQA